MSNPTTPFSWQMPTPTDLVTDLPADFEVFGQAVATSMADLLGGTSGQVLAKNSNTDMDFVWVAQDDSNAIQNSIVDAKGDLIAASAADTPARLAVGTNGQTVVADSTAATGLKYSNNAPLGGMTEITSGGIALTGASTITVSGISNKSRLSIIVSAASSTNASSLYKIRFNADSGSNYGYGGLFSNGGVLANAFAIADTGVAFAKQGNSAADVVSGVLNCEGAFAAGMLQINLGSSATGIGFESYNWSGFYNGSAQITSVSIVSSVGNFDAGTMYIYGA